MGRPKGSRNKVTETISDANTIIENVGGNENEVQGQEEKEVIPEGHYFWFDEKTKTKHIEKIEELSEHEQFFEAPDGRLLKGSKDATRLWDRKMNNGQGGWINPKR